MTNLDTKGQDPAANPESPNPISHGPAPQFAVASAPSYARTLFLGPDGLRFGWGLAFYAVGFLILQRLLVDLAWSHDWGASGLWSSMLAEFASLLAAIIPSVVLARVEQRRWSAYGLPPSWLGGRLFCVGSLWGFASITILIFALSGFHAFSFGHVVLHGLRIWKFAAFWGIFFLLVGLFEEFLLRGYSQFTLARGVGFWPAALGLSCAFGLIHLKNEQEHWPGVLAAACIGLFFCLTLRRTGSLWFAVGFHASWDWGETFFYSVPDSGMTSPGHLLSSTLHGPTWLSGGGVGPEGSVLCFVVIALAWTLFAKVHRTPLKPTSGLNGPPSLPT